MLDQLFQRFDSGHARREVEEELRFHLDLLTEDHRRRRTSLEEAKAGALKQFGNLEQIRDECVAISKRNRPHIRALKIFLTVVFLVGILVRVFSPEYRVTRIGDLLIAVGILSRLLLYVRLHPSVALPKPETSVGLNLGKQSDNHFSFYDQERRTPVERVIFKE